MAGYSGEPTEVVMGIRDKAKKKVKRVVGTRDHATKAPVASESRTHEICGPDSHENAVEAIVQRWQTVCAIKKQLLHPIDFYHSPRRTRLPRVRVVARRLEPADAKIR